MQINMKKINRRDLLFAAAIVFLTAFLLLIPSRMTDKGTSPGESALNAVILISKCTDEIYEKFDEIAITVICKSLTLDKDFSGIAFWEEYVLRRYGK